MRTEISKQAQEMEDERKQLSKAVRAQDESSESESEAASQAEEKPTGVFAMEFMKKARAKAHQAEQESENSEPEEEKETSETNNFTHEEIQQATQEISHLIDNPWLAKEPQSKKTPLAATKPEETRKEAKQSSVWRAPDESASEDEIFKKFNGPLDEEQRALVKQLFQGSMVHSETHLENFQAENKKTEEAATESLPGWGRWVGVGTTKRSRRASKRKGPESAIVKKPKPTVSRVIVSESVLKTSEKRLPYPFKTQDEYEAVQSGVTAPELMTMSAHKRAIAPKLNVRLGAVIPRLDTSKQLSNAERDLLIDAWKNRRKPNRTKTRL